MYMRFLKCATLYNFLTNEFVALVLYKPKTGGIFPSRRRCHRTEMSVSGEFTAIKFLFSAQISSVI